MPDLINQPARISNSGLASFLSHATNWILLRRRRISLVVLHAQSARGISDVSAGFAYCVSAMRSMRNGEKDFPHAPRFLARSPVISIALTAETLGDALEDPSFAMLAAIFGE